SLHLGTSNRPGERAPAARGPGGQEGERPVPADHVRVPVLGARSPLYMKRAKYEKELHKLQVKLCHLQRWVKEKGLRVVVVFEGRDVAWKGGTIKALTDRVSPRVF